MSDTSVQTAPSAGISGAPPSRMETSQVELKAPPSSWLVRNVLQPLASLKLTVFLFVLSLLLVFFGTLAQIDSGIGTVMKQYFRSWLVWVPVQLLVQFAQVFFAVPKSVQVQGSFPFPAGWTVGALLLANLLAAHAVRFKLTWKRSGILILHAGLIILMLGELFTGLFAVEARMSIAEGETVNFTDVSDRLELAVSTPDREDASKDRVVVVPDRLLRQPGHRIQHQELPFDVVVREFWPNSTLIESSPHQPVELPHARRALDGRDYGVSIEAESSGVDAEGRSDYPAAKVAFYKKDSDELLGELFVSLWYYPNNVNRQLEFPPQTVSVDGTTYEIELRPKREYKDYAITLLKFTHEKYLGTDKAKNFQSTVLLKGTDGESREVKIYMNNPLRYRGETFYQSSFFPGNSGTVLQVVRNPAWLMPYFSCTLVTLGMMVHFGLSLASFLGRRVAS